MAKVTGGAIIAKMLKAEGVEKVFGIIDGTYLGMLAALQAEGIQIIGPRHETSAAHMAGAYARLTGKLGVCIASNGPGVANILPGVAVENGEGHRVLLITSTRRTGIGYPDRGGTYQYFNQVGVIGQMAKWSGAVSAMERVPEMTRRALRKSYMGRPGVVHLDVPENIMNGKTVLPVGWEPHNYRKTSPIHPARTDIKKAAEILSNAKLPLIHAGNGVLHAGATEELKHLAELLQCPVTTSWAARAAIDERSPHAISMVHVELNNEVRNEADAVLILGSRMGETDWWGKAPNWKEPFLQKTIQVDCDEELLGMNKPTEVAILSDAKVFLEQLIVELQRMAPTDNLQKRKAKLQEYGQKMKKSRAKLDKELSDNGPAINPARVVHTCRNFFNDDAIVVFDGGNTAVWGNFYHESRTVNTCLSTYKFGHLGAGVAQALGAAVAFPDRQVYCMIGDGAFGFHPQEIETAVRNKLKVVYIVFCDRQWGMVKMTMQFAFRPIKTMIKKSLDEGETINADLNEIRYDDMARAMGAHGERVSKLEDLLPALERAQAAETTAVIHVDVNPVKHMWAPGLLHFKEMHQEPKG